MQVRAFPFSSVQYKLESFRIVSVFAKLYIERDFSFRISNPYLPKIYDHLLGKSNSVF